VQRAEGVPLRRAGAKTTGKVWGARTSAETANREECREIEETGKPWRMAEERPKQREDKRRYWGEVIPEGSLCIKRRLPGDSPGRVKHHPQRAYGRSVLWFACLRETPK
jgi:hypothetical protein